MLPRQIRWFFLVLSTLLVLSSLLAGCGGGGASETEHTFPMADLASMPMEVRSAPVAVQQAYQFAVANPSVLTQLPCYCGCGAMGHTSNYACYVAGRKADGTPQFDPHALGCSICVDITQDAMRMLRQGKSITEIRSAIDDTYSRFGPSNMP